MRSFNSERDIALAARKAVKAAKAVDLRTFSPQAPSSPAP